MPTSAHSKRRELYRDHHMNKGSDTPDEVSKMEKFVSDAHKAMDKAKAPLVRYSRRTPPAIAPVLCLFSLASEPSACPVIVRVLKATIAILPQARGLLPCRAPQR